MTCPEHAAHDPDHFIPIQYRGGGAPLRPLHFSTEIRYRSALFEYRIGTIRYQYGTGTIGYRSVEIGYSLPDLYRPASSPVLLWWVQPSENEHDDDPSSISVRPHLYTYFPTILYGSEVYEFTIRGER